MVKSALCHQLQGRGKKVHKAKMGDNLTMYYNEEVRGRWLGFDVGARRWCDCVPTSRARRQAFALLQAWL